MAKEGEDGRRTVDFGALVAEIERHMQDGKYTSFSETVRALVRAGLEGAARSAAA